MAKQQRNRPAKPGASKVSNAGQLRIIGGQWRSRRLPVVSVPGLRPTPDRVRETLFNWLQMTVPGARCLDLFAGSGALGFEALSREATEVVMVEQHPAAFAQLQANMVTLGAGKVQLLQADALTFLASGPAAFDLIFLDPPFRQGFIEQALDLIGQYGLLKAGGMVYLEYENGLMPNFAAWGLEVFRETRAGQVVSVLLSEFIPIHSIYYT